MGEPRDPSEQTIQLSSAARIIPPSFLSNERWAVESFIGPKHWKVSVPAVMLLLACIEENSRRAVLDRVASLTLAPRENLETLLTELERCGLIVSSDASKANGHASICQKIPEAWAKANWSEAAEYHLSTLDYPFPDYSTNGRQIDTDRMRGYIGEEPDVDRYKRIADPVSRRDLPAPDASLCDVPLAEALRDYLDPDPAQDAPVIDDAVILNLLSMTFCEVGLIKGGRWQRAPMMRRTSPSGGGRHPSEAYLLVMDVPGLKPGWYHVDVSPPQLSLMREAVFTDSELRELFPLGYGRAPFDVKCLVALTTIFERNMYRYREPRTFRTVHMDIGHLATTLGLAASAHQIMTHVAYADDDEAIERSLGLDGLEEGYMLTVSLGIPSTDAQ
ncbi:MAG TPA: SagB/ThcOx family dehydrogenase [Allosphingosinicella sp.]|nr:SagB/ThcOx family dehydrogenase [Allosphingosinicella sp.]